MLLRKPGRKVWIFRAMVGGKTWERSTGETILRRAKLKVPELENLARLHRSQPTGLPSLDQAIVKEVTRLETDVSERQAERVSTALTNFREWAGDVSLEKIDTPLIESYQRKRLTEAARATVDKELTAIVRMLATCGLTVRKPPPKPGIVTEQRHFTQPELKRFFEHCPSDYKPLFLTMLVTGARPAELIPSPRSTHITLLKTELDPKANLITIRSAKERRSEQRSKRTRHLQIPKKLMSMLVKQAKATPGDHVFTPIPTLARLFNSILEEAKIEKKNSLGEKLTAHSFRHTFATQMSEQVGFNQMILMRILGHSQIATTARYCHPIAPTHIMDINSYLRPGKRGQTHKKE